MGTINLMKLTLRIALARDRIKFVLSRQMVGNLYLIKNYVLGEIKRTKIEEQLFPECNNELQLFPKGAGIEDQLLPRLAKTEQQLFPEDK